MTHPPSGPSTPPPPSGPKTPAKLAAELGMADLLLRTIGVLALPGMDPAARMQLAHGLRIARRAIEAAQSPARRDLESVATPGGPVQATQMVLGERPTPGLGAALGRAVTGSDGAVVAPVAGANSGREGKVAAATASSRPVEHPAGRPPLPGGGGEGGSFRLPVWPGTALLAASFDRRA